MHKRVRIAVLLVAISLALFSVGITIAFIASSSKPVINTFTVGDIQLSLTETTGTAYKLIPGTTINKNPHLTVKAGSDACWLFFRAHASANLADCITYTPAAGWTLLPGTVDVYYRQVDRTDSDLSFQLLQSDTVFVKESLTEQQMAVLSTAPTLSFVGYAIQTYGVVTAEYAWQQLIIEGVTTG